MINEEKVGLMTKIAIYEKRQESQDIVISKYYSEDYIKYHCLTTLVAATVCFFIVIGLYVMINFQQLLNDINDMDYMGMVQKLMVAYGIYVGVTLVFAYIAYFIKFQLARKGLTGYNHNLNKLIEFYDRQDRVKKHREAVKKGKIKVSSNIGGDDLDLVIDGEGGDR